MPRFDPEVYRINTSENILESLISYKFRRNYIRDDEISKGFEYFKTVSEEGNLYFSHGEFIVTSNDWVVSAFKSFTHPFLLSFVNLRTGVKEIGTSISSPSMGLPFFSSPLASFDNLAIGVINTSIIRSIKNSSNIQKMVSDGSLSMELAQIILSDRDLEDQVLVVYRFR